MPGIKIDLPFGPGDGLWYAAGAADKPENEGPALYQPLYQEDAIESIRVGAGNEIAIVEYGCADVTIPHSGEACFSEEETINWIKANIKNPVLLDGREVSALHITDDGAKCPVRGRLGIRELESLVGLSIATTEIDEDGYMAVFDADARKEQGNITSFTLDRAGNPVGVMYGAYLIVRTERSDDGTLRLADIGPELLGEPAMDPPPREYDPALRADLSGMTVEKFARMLLAKYPWDAKICCCGSGGAWLHCTRDGTFANIDCEDLGCLPEYSGGGG